MIIEQYLQCDNCTARTSVVKSDKEFERVFSRLTMIEAAANGWTVGRYGSTVDICPKCREAGK